MSAALSGGMIFLGFCFVLGAFILVSTRIYMISSEFVMKILKYILIAFIWLIFSVASIAVGFRIDSRHSESYSRGLKSVSEIWGGEINQFPPSLTYPTKITEEYQNEKTGETKERIRTVNESLGFHSQILNLKLSKTIRQKGLLIFPGYELDFVGTFIIKNTKNSPNTLYFHLNLPQFAGNISDIKVELNGKTYERDTNLADGVDWSGNLASGEEQEIKIFYKARGTGGNYSFLCNSAGNHLLSNLSICEHPFSEQARSIPPRGMGGARNLPELGYPSTLVFHVIFSYLAHLGRQIAARRKNIYLGISSLHGVVE